MSFVDLTKFQSYKMLPENPDKIQSDTSSMLCKFQKGNQLFQGICVQEPFVQFPLTQVCQRLGAEPVGFWMDEKSPPKKVKSHRKDTWKSSLKFKSKEILVDESTVLQGNFWFMWLLEKKSGELGPIVEVSLSCEDFRFQTQHPQHQVQIWWESTGFHSNSLNSEFWDYIISATYLLRSLQKQIVTLVMFIRIQQKAPQPWWVAPQQVGARAIRGKGSMRWRCGVEPCGGDGQKGGKWEVEVVGFLFCELFGYKKNHSRNWGRWPNLQDSFFFFSRVELHDPAEISKDFLLAFCFFESIFWGP